LVDIHIKATGTFSVSVRSFLFASSSSLVPFSSFLLVRFALLRSFLGSVRFGSVGSQKEASKKFLLLLSLFFFSSLVVLFFFFFLILH